MEAVAGVALGIGLAAAVGFRVFVPFLVAAIAARADLVPLTSGFDWLASDAALVVLGVATAAEILGYAIPWVDHLLDAIAAPVAVVAGTLLVAAVAVDLPPVWRWTIAAIAGGGVAGAVQGGSAVARLGSSITTGGLGNIAVSALELVGAVVLSVLAVLAPIAAAVAVVVLLVAVGRRIVRRRRARHA